MPLPDESGWTITADAEHQEASGTHRLAMDLDPRARTVTLGLRIVSGGNHDISSGAIARSFLPLEQARWAPAVDWLRGGEARGLLDMISAGYQIETMWTGDQRVRWSDAAWEAGSTLLERVVSLVSD